ncbi:hypothetical protein B0A55_11303 [Friedmanniomyces simplex]|uniref:BTB domain-containing protein n=1 Tax=Friedmanniomyces simplex TaxID=329884 RepID=A0A4U0W7R0_9PEZI|nr:hypothetical protein B0A55_11303 [Friedmanniomyces simplex]
MSSLRASGHFSDLTIICGTRTFKVHKAFVCAQSEYFNTKCRTPWPTISATVIKLEDIRDDTAYMIPEEKALDDEDTIERMVKFLYALDYPAREGEWMGTLSIAKLFAVAIKYQIPALRKAAAERFAMEAEAVGGRFDGGVAEFAGAMKLVYTTTPADVRELRDVVEQTLLYDTQLLEKAVIKEALSGITGVVYELLMKKPHGAGRRRGISEEANGI